MEEGIHRKEGGEGEGEGIQRKRKGRRGYIPPVGQLCRCCHEQQPQPPCDGDVPPAAQTWPLATGRVT